MLAAIKYLLKVGGSTHDQVSVVLDLRLLAGSVDCLLLMSLRTPWIEQVKVFSHDFRLGFVAVALRQLQRYIDKPQSVGAPSSLVHCANAACRVRNC